MIYSKLYLLFKSFVSQNVLTFLFFVGCNFRYKIGKHFLIVTDKVFSFHFPSSGSRPDYYLVHTIIQVTFSVAELGIPISHLIIKLAMARRLKCLKMMSSRFLLFCIT